MGSSAARKKISALTSRQTSMKTAGRPIITATYPAGDRCQAGSSALIVWFSCERAKAGSAIRLATSASPVTTGQARRATVSQRDRQSGSAGLGGLAGQGLCGAGGGLGIVPFPSSSNTPSSMSIR